MKGTTMFLRLCGGALLLCTLSAEAAFVFDIRQIDTGPPLYYEVIITGSGTINTNSLGKATDQYIPPFESVNSSLTIGQGVGETYFTPISAPQPFGGGGYNPLTAGSGDLVGFSAGLGDITVPLGYVSGGQLEGSEIGDGYFLSSLGLQPGDFFYGFGSGNDADTIEVVIEPLASTVDEPNSIGLLGIGLTGVIGMSVFRRRRK